MFKERIDKLSSSLSDDEAILIESDANRFYLTGMRSSFGMLIITKEETYFLIDFRYFERAKAVVKHCETILYERVSQAADIIKKHGIKKLYVETSSMSIARKAALSSVISGAVILDDGKADVLIKEMRSVKTVSEISLIKKAQEMTDKTFSYILERIEPGRSEKDVALDMEFYMRKLGSEGVSFDFIVVSGKNSSLPHGVPTDKLIEKGDFITMDFGAVVGGYRSDMTRTVAVGQVSDKQRDVYETVLKAQKAALDSIKPGVVCKNIDKIARDLIESRYKGCFGHGLGHSVGIEIHEAPTFDTRCETLLKEGTVITVEPGIYIENEFGVRIEDMVCVTSDGCEDITASSKDLIIL